MADSVNACRKANYSFRMPRELIISCEHAGNEVPASYRSLFEKDSHVLQTHRGLDIGALDLTRTLGKILKTDIHVHTITRLLVDLNRSLANPTVFSEFMHDLDRRTLKQVVEDYYLPHRNKLEHLVESSALAGKPILHISVHTFTPELNGSVRNGDVGFLYDPKRTGEKNFCRTWRNELRQKLPDMRYRMNYPYLGTTDGFTTYLRGKFSEEEYLGVELEVNQKLVEFGNAKEWKLIQQKIALALKNAVDVG